MNRNEKILAGLLGLFFVGYLLRGPIVAATTGPLDELRTSLSGRTEQAEALSDQAASITAAAGRVNAARRRSLPADVSYAERLYPQWLQDLAIASGWTEVTTTLQSVQSRRGEQFRPVRVELRGSATLAEYERFLDRFRRTDLLHRITKTLVSSESEVEDVKLDVTLQVEGLSLPTAAERDEIFPVARLAADLAENAAEVVTFVPEGLAGRSPSSPASSCGRGTNS